MKFKSNNFHCLGENTEKHVRFSVSIDKETNEETDKTTECKIRFIDSLRFIPVQH